MTVNPAFGWGQSAAMASGVQDQISDLLRMRDQGQMAGLDLDRLGLHPIGHEAVVLEQPRSDRLALPRVHASATLADPQQPKSSPRSLWDETSETGDLHSAPRWSHSCVLPEIAPGRD